MKKINRYQYLKAQKEYFRLCDSTNLNDEEQKLLDYCKNIYFNYETLDEFDPIYSRMDRLLFYLPLTILFPIWAIYDNWDVYNYNFLLESFAIFFLTLLFLILTTFFTPVAFITALILLPYWIAYNISTLIILEILIKIIKEDIVNKIINFGSSFRLWFHNKLVKIYKY